jgi:hypothetical protein
MGNDTMAFGRDQADWDQLARAGEIFLVERARLGGLTSYTELNVTLQHRTGLRSFDFEMQAERAAMGHLLGLIVVEQNRPLTGLMISALVIYLGGNDAGPGFYKLAQDLGELPPGSLSSGLKESYWVGQVKSLYTYYRGGAHPGRYSTKMALTEAQRDDSDGGGRDLLPGRPS